MGVYADWWRIFRDRGFYPRPIRVGKKACFENEWQLPDPEQPPGTFERWDVAHRDDGIGLLMGSPIGDGTRLGALDIDHDLYIRVGRALFGEPLSGRFGSKGLVYFVRVRGDLGSPEFKAQLEAGPFKVAECLFDRRLCVIPPTIHPDTHLPYRWVGTPLHELTDLTMLPLIEG